MWWPWPPSTDFTVLRCCLILLVCPYWYDASRVENITGPCFSVIKMQSYLIGVDNFMLKEIIVYEDAYYRSSATICQSISRFPSRTWAGYNIWLRRSSIMSGVSSTTDVRIQPTTSSLRSQHRPRPSGKTDRKHRDISGLALQDWALQAPAASREQPCCIEVSTDQTQSTPGVHYSHITMKDWRHPRHSLQWPQYDDR